MSTTCAFLYQIFGGPRIGARNWRVGCYIRRLVGLLALGLLLAGPAVGCAPAAAPHSEHTPASGSAPTPHADHDGHAELLQIVHAGITRPYEMGSAVPIGGGLKAHFIVSTPAGVRGQRNLDVYLRRGDGGEAVADARLLVTGTMLHMAHGMIRPTVVNSSDGHFVVPVDFTMAGEWDLEIEVTTPEESGIVHLTLDVYD
jgi:hypothetical protein